MPEDITTNNFLLDVQSIHKKLSGAFTLGEISFSQAENEKLCVTGETGSGKSSLLRIIAGLLQPDSGNAFLEGKRIPGPDEKLLPGHPKIAYLSQDHELRNNYRMQELLDYANRMESKDAAEIYRLCRIDHLFIRRNDQLSGGEKQRVALARLLVGAPKLLLLDEPFSNLDLIHKNILKQVIHDLSTRLGISCILSSHDPTDTLSWADRVLAMRSGKIVQDGSPAEIYHRPASEYAGGLFGSYNLLDNAAARVFGIEIASDRKLFIRPENMQLVSTGGVSGRIRNAVFKGHYYELTIALETFEIIAMTTQPPTNSVEARVMLSPGDHWVL